jgi:hypothetical protein
MLMDSTLMVIDFFAFVVYVLVSCPRFSITGSFRGNVNACCINCTGYRSYFLQIDQFGEVDNNISGRECFFWIARCPKDFHCVRNLAVVYFAITSDAVQDFHSTCQTESSTFKAAESRTRS